MSKGTEDENPTLIAVDFTLSVSAVFYERDYNEDKETIMRMLLEPPTQNQFIQHMVELGRFTIERVEIHKRSQDHQDALDESNISTTLTIR